ncbi:SGNH/GDSL hydrolase family protein [uncultured Chitinophaga sp.]|uniref:SGNH/GDSL hydrolase family protein n=1 Tax=uncultured Chitinophaga sp. TaxID=339340 RepID=UPI0025CB7A73|nr:SGNH/GDSL hydrolase family protein [uncultured Chitinophaga sp.]
MRHLLLLIWLLLLCSTSSFAQITPLKVMKDTVRVENAELIIENGTKEVKGFLYNAHGGNTSFKQLGKTFQFRPGDAGFPAVGESSFSNPELVNTYIKVWRNGLLQYRNYARGVLIDKETGVISFYPPLSDTDRVYIETAIGFEEEAPVDSLPENNLNELHAGIFDNGDNTFVLRWTTNHSSLYQRPVMGGIGSSTLEGTGTEAPNRLRDRIGAWLSSSAISPTWLNVAVGGFTTKDVMPMEMGGVPGHTISTTMQMNPDFIYCCLNSNDAANGIPVAQSMVRLRQIDSIGKSRGVPIIFHTTQPRNSIGSNLHLLTELGDSIRQTWPKRHVDGWAVVVDPNTPGQLNPLFDSGDGLHLNATGTLALSLEVFKVLENYFVPISGVSRYYIDTSYDGVQWAPFDVIQSGNVVKKSYTKPRQGLIYFRVRAEKAAAEFVTSTIAKLLPPKVVIQPDHRILIDLGGDNLNTVDINQGLPGGRKTASPDKFGNYWNNWFGSGGALGFRDGANIRDLVTTINRPTPLTVELIGTPATDGSFTTKALNFDGIAKDIGDYPAEAVRDNFFVNAGNVGENGVILRVKGLSSGNTYKIKMLGTRIVVPDGNRFLQSKVGNEPWTAAKIMETRYQPMQPGDYDNAITHVITGVDSADIYIKPRNATYAHISVLDIGITGTLPLTPWLTINDTSIVLPKDSLLLVPGIETNNIAINTYEWTQVSGPSVANIRSSNTANTVIAGLSNGVYVFKLKLTTATSNIVDEVAVSVFPASPKPAMRVYFSATAANPVPGWVNLYGEPSQAVITANATTAPWSISSVSTATWAPLGPSNGSNTDGEVTGNNSGGVPDEVLKGFWYNYTGISEAHNLRISGLIPSKKYRITIVGSRSSSKGATAPKSGYYAINGASQWHDAYQNKGLYESAARTGKTVYTDISPNSAGLIYIDVYVPAGAHPYGSTSFINALIVEEQ